MARELNRESARPAAINEYRTVGPPGCGKTTWLREQLERCGEKESAIVMSFTRAAAAEVAGQLRPPALGPEQVEQCRRMAEEGAGQRPTHPTKIGTLHSFAFRSWHSPSIALDKNILPSWNRLYPHYEMTPVRPGVSGPIQRDSRDASHPKRGDVLMALYERYRATLTTDLMPAVVRHFGDRWGQWKRDNQLADFTDLIEWCLDSVSAAPGYPDAIFVDEAQDLTPLEWQLVRKWGSHARRLVTVGDPDQTIFNWRGASPTGMTALAVPTERLITLTQSYRVPREVHGRALRWIDRIQGRERIEYLPRSAQGEVRTSPATWRQPETVIDEAESHLSRREEVMFIASCRYMLRYLLQQLRHRGIPFHNPYRRSDHEWNPLTPRFPATMADCLRAFLRGNRERAWTVQEIRMWSDPLNPAGVFRRGAEAQIQKLIDSGGNDVIPAVMQLFLTDQAIEAGGRGDAEWWRHQLKPANLRAAEYPLAVVKRFGPEALLKTPRAIVGTIHSIKGAETDVVFVFPDLSPSGSKEWRGPPVAQANIRRLFYVAMTRSRHTLVLCSPAGHNAPSL